MGEVPPVVRYRAVDAPAYLLAWGHRPDGSWAALLAWVSWTADGHRGHEAWVTAGEVEPMTGQDYSGVPRRRLGEDPDGRRTDSSGRPDTAKRPDSSGIPDSTKRSDSTEGPDRSGVPSPADRPFDPTDPRDPRHGDRATDRAVIEQRRRHEEPDF